MIIRIINKKNRGICAVFDDRDFEIVIGVSPMGTLEKEDPEQEAVNRKHRVLHEKSVEETKRTAATVSKVIDKMRQKFYKEHLDDIFTRTMENEKNLKMMMNFLQAKFGGEFVHAKLSTRPRNEGVVTPPDAIFTGDTPIPQRPVVETVRVDPDEVKEVVAKGQFQAETEEGLRKMAKAWFGDERFIIDNQHAFSLSNQTTFVAQIDDDHKPLTHLATIVKCHGIEFLRIEDSKGRINKMSEFSILEFAGSNPSDDLMASTTSQDATYFWIEGREGGKHEFKLTECDDGVSRWRPIVDYPQGRPKVHPLQRNGAHLMDAECYTNAVGHLTESPKSTPEVIHYDFKKKEGFEVNAVRVKSGVDGAMPLYAGCESWKVSGLDLVKWDDFDEKGWHRTVREINKMFWEHKNPLVLKGGILHPQTKLDDGMWVALPSGAELKVVECDDNVNRLAVMSPPPENIEDLGDI